MTVWVDAKGKVFTNVVQKDSVPALIQTVTGQIHGLVYVHPDHRLLDEMNQEPRFIAVTDARVIGPDGAVSYHAPFLTLNKAHIVWMRPDEETSAPAQED